MPAGVLSRPHTLCLLHRLAQAMVHVFKGTVIHGEYKVGTMTMTTTHSEKSSICQMKA